MWRYLFVTFICLTQALVSQNDFQELVKKLEEMTRGEFISHKEELLNNKSNETLEAEKGSSLNFQIPSVEVEKSIIDEVKEKINRSCIMLFSKSFCPYCKLIKKIFHGIGADYDVIELDQHPNGRLMQDVLENMTGARTVPRVFISGEFIGGSSDTSQKHTDGSLLKLINQCKETP